MKSWLVLLLFAFTGFSLQAFQPKGKPVLVFILAGQSNMEGQGFIAAEPKRNGGKGSLEYLVKDTTT
ncbi:MAG: sialate O-acetylesterase, partial [Planctomycetia bacterium]